MKHRLKQEVAKESMEFCGFVCPACNFRLRLSDPLVAQAVVDLFNRGLHSTSLECSECGHEQQYSQGDLQMFLSGGRQAPLSTRLSSRGIV
jgi:Zn ribbon nucleic-acid-binding protein